MKKLVLLAIALGSLAVACTPPPTTINIQGSGGTENTGGSDGTGGTGDTGGSDGSGGTGATGGSNSVAPTTARDIYMQKVQPALIDKCGTCHQASAELGPGWMDTDPATSYELSKLYPGVVTDPPSDSIIVTKPVHDGPAADDIQKALVIEWLEMELKEVKPDPGMTGTPTSTGKSAEEMLKEFGACMNYDIWLASGMALLPDQQTELGPCKSCHNQGLGGTYLSADPQMTFDANRAMPFILRMVLPVYEGAKPVDLSPSLRFEQKGTEQCNNANPALCHPKYNLTPENIKAMENFVGGTLTKWRAGACAP